MRADAGAPSEAVNNAARYMLFVEGSSDEAIDPVVLGRLLQDTVISVKPLGSCMSVVSTAQSLHPSHPTYYFVVDRDHQTDTEVNNSWSNFPNPNTQNLLIWRKRELENYFLDPSYLCKSKFLTKCSEQQLKDKILRFAKERVFLDIANRTITRIREWQKAEWVKGFTNLADFPTSQKALEQLKKYTPLVNRANEIGEQMKVESIEKLFSEIEAFFLGGASTPEYGKGQWLEQMHGKPMLKSVINECFKVRDADDNIQTGNDAVNLVAMELLERDE